MDDKIGLDNNKLREIRGETLNAIWKSTPAAGAAKNKFNKMTRQIKKYFDRKILDFKLYIRSARKSTDQHSERSFHAKEKKEPPPKKKYKNSVLIEHVF